MQIAVMQNIIFASSSQWSGLLCMWKGGGGEKGGKEGVLSFFMCLSAFVVKGAELSAYFGRIYFESGKKFAKSCWVTEEFYFLLRLADF